MSRRALVEALAGGSTAIEVGALTELGLLANDRGELDEADRWLTQAWPVAERVRRAAESAEPTCWA